MKLSLLIILLLVSNSSFGQVSTETKIYRLTIIFRNTHLRRDWQSVLLRYANWVHKTNISQEQYFKTIESMNNKIYGGTPVVGEFTITSKYLEFIPYSDTKWFVNEVKSLKIPIQDIKETQILENKGIFITQHFKIKTKNGDIFCMKPGKYRFDFSPIWGNSYHEDICKKINSLTCKTLKKNVTKL